jgi:hypothetical protein
MKKSFVGFVSLIVALSACGGDDETQTAGHADDRTSGGERHDEVDDGIQIEGLMGTISQTSVSRALEPRMGRFAQCFSDRYDALDMVGGSIQFSFRIQTDGTVKWVYPRASTIGDRQTEACLLGVAGSTRFDRPQGGEAEFSWPLAFDPPEDVRPPLTWEAERATETINEHSSNVRSACGRGPFLVTAYVRPGGEVMAVGASTTDQTSADNLDCVTTAVAGWMLPDPGSYPAKITFEIR